jgi:ribosomal protein S18 acetylase RimI-like enzyme
MGAGTIELSTHLFGGGKLSAIDEYDADVWLQIVRARSDERNRTSSLHVSVFMSTVRPRLASEADLALLLSMMEPFNALEHTTWDAAAKERALRTLVRDRKLGVTVLLEGAAGILGYFVLTWGYDLEWDGRDAFLTELFLLPAVRGRGHGSGALAVVEAVAREHEARALHLMVRHENIVAKRLYTSHGYTSPPRQFLSKQL